MTLYTVNKKTLKLARDIGHCPCNLAHPCPCDEWLDKDMCKCGAYVKVKDEKIKGN